MNNITQEFRLHHEDNLVEQARYDGLETLGEVRDLVWSYMQELEDQIELMHDSFLQGLVYDSLQEVDVTTIEDNICSLLDISLDTY